MSRSPFCYAHYVPQFSFDTYSHAQLELSVSCNSEYQLALDPYEKSVVRKSQAKALGMNPLFETCCGCLPVPF